MSTGLIITLIIILFIVGTIMGLRPSAKENRLDRLRTTARKLELHPKLIPAPDWITGNAGERGKGMVAQYGVVIPDVQLMPCEYQIIDGKWRPLTQHYPANFGLDNMPVDFPPSIAPYVKGLIFKANFAGIYWQENIGLNSDKLETTENDLILLKTKLEEYMQLIKNYK